MMEESRREYQGTYIQHGNLEVNMRKEHGYKGRVNY